MEVKAYYTILGKEKGGYVYAFKIGEYDKNKQLLIDPILRSTYLSGSGNGGEDSECYAITVSPTGDVYVTGSTQSSDFPGVDNSSADSNFAVSEAFVSWLSSDLTIIKRSTFLGGSGSDRSNSIAISPSGDVYITGWTASPDFPGIDENSADRTYRGGKSFTSWLSYDLTTIKRSTFLGSNNNDSYDYSYDIAVSHTGDVYVTGYTSSSDFPGVDDNSADSKFAGSQEAFISWLSGDLTQIKRSTFLGGSSGEVSYGIAISPSGDVYVTGWTRSPDFPGIDPGSADSSFGGWEEAFVTWLSSDLTTIKRSTFLGGRYDDTGYGIAISPSKDIYVTGYTNSFSDFPGVDDNSADSKLAGSQEAFISWLSGDLTQIKRSTFLGGSNRDKGYSIAISPTGDIYVAGATKSSDFPGITPDSVDPTYGGGEDAFVARVTSDLSAFSTNHPPNTPSPPSGPSNGYTNTSYSFFTSTTDPDGDSVSYRYDWGDGHTSGWDSSTQSHSWDTTGNFCVKAQAKDSHGATSGWSSCHYIDITQQNRPPTMDSFTANPTSGPAPLAVNFTCSAHDPDGPIDHYEITYGDESSDTSITGSFTHTYQDPGSYTATCKAVDDQGNESFSSPIIVDVYIKGDADGDQIFDIVDALLTSMHHLGIQVSGNFNFQAADVDGNQVVNMEDALGIAEVALGIQGF